MEDIDYLLSKEVDQSSKILISNNNLQVVRAKVEDFFQDLEGKTFTEYERERGLHGAITRPWIKSEKNPWIFSSYQFVDKTHEIIFQVGDSGTGHKYFGMNHLIGFLENGLYIGWSSIRDNTTSIEYECVYIPER